MIIALCICIGVFVCLGFVDARATGYYGLFLFLLLEVSLFVDVHGHVERIWGEDVYLV